MPRGSGSARVRAGCEWVMVLPCVLCMFYSRCFDVRSSRPAWRSSSPSCLPNPLGRALWRS